MVSRQPRRFRAPTRTPRGSRCRLAVEELERRLTPTQAPTPVLSPEQAVARAVNDLQPTADGFLLRHPGYSAAFTAGGLDVTPARGGPHWQWQFAFAGTEGGPVTGVEAGPVPPTASAGTLVQYDRGGLVEQYVLHGGTIEQQFVLPEPLALNGNDLVVAGSVDSIGELETHAGGWAWRDAGGQVSLGQVSVYDALGTPLAAQMEVSQTGTRILVDDEALAQAVYPVLIDPEIGANDFRISDMGPDGNANFSAFNPVVAYNSVNNEYLIVWLHDDDTGGLVDNEFEIYGQRFLAGDVAGPPAPPPTPPPPAPPAPQPRGIQATLVTKKVGKKRKLFVRVSFADTGEVKAELLSPFQKPNFRAIAVTLEDRNGDTAADSILVTARKDRRLMRRVFAV